MYTDQKDIIVPYVSYIALGIVALVIILMILFKFAARDNRYSSNSELYIYSRPETNQRKNNANKKPRKNTFLAPPKPATKEDSIPSID